MKIKLLLALMSAIILFTGCAERDAKEGTIIKNGDNTVCNEPIDDSEYNKEELYYINTARSLYLLDFDVDDCCTELDKARLFSWIISTDIYEDEVENWKDENDGFYKIPLEDIEKIVFTRLDTDIFDPVVAFTEYNKTYHGYESCSDGTYGYDIQNKLYIPRVIDGYGGAAALGVLQFEEVDNTIKVVLGSYDMNKFYSDTPEYVLGCKYTVTFFNDTDNVEKYKILSAVKEELQEQIPEDENAQIIDQGIAELIEETKTMEKNEFLNEAEREQFERICEFVPTSDKNYWLDANELDSNSLYMYYYITRLDNYIEEVGIDNIDTVTAQEAITEDHIDFKYFLIPDDEVEGYLQRILNIDIETIQKIPESFEIKDNSIDKRFYYFRTVYGFGGGYLFGIEDCWKKDNTFIFRLLTLDDEYLGQSERYIKLEYYYPDDYKYLCEYTRKIKKGEWD